MRIQVNGESREIEADLALTDLVASLNLKPEQIAIELNNEVVRRSAWSSITVHDGDRIEIVHFVGGG